MRCKYQRDKNNEQEKQRHEYWNQQVDENGKKHSIRMRKEFQDIITTLITCSSSAGFITVEKLL